MAVQLESAVGGRKPQAVRPCRARGDAALSVGRNALEGRTVVSRLLSQGS